MSAATASRCQRFARKIRTSHKLYGFLVSGSLALYVVIDILTGFLLSWVPGEHGPDALQDNPLLAFLGVLVIPAAMILTIIGTLWVFDNRRCTDTANSNGHDALNWTRRIWGTIFLFIGTFVALSFTPDGLGPIPLIGLAICWGIGRVWHTR